MIDDSFLTTYNRLPSASKFRDHTGRKTALKSMRKETDGLLRAIDEQLMRMEQSKAERGRANVGQYARLYFL